MGIENFNKTMNDSNSAAIDAAAQAVLDAQAALAPATTDLAASKTDVVNAYQALIAYLNGQIAPGGNPIDASWTTLTQAVVDKSAALVAKQQAFDDATALAAGNLTAYQTAVDAARAYLGTL